MLKDKCVEALTSIFRNISRSLSYLNFLVLMLFPNDVLDIPTCSEKLIEYKRLIYKMII